jgi:hypothetical protein
MPIFPIAENFLTKEDLPMWGWILRTIAVGAGKALTLGEYNRIKQENKLKSDYHILIAVLNEIASKRAVTCKVDETSRDCPISYVIPHYHQPGRTTDGTAPLRIFTLMGTDGQIINIQGFDLMQTVKVTVRHTNGTFDVETVDPSDALKRIEREAGIRR